MFFVKVEKSSCNELFAYVARTLSTLQVQNLYERGLVQPIFPGWTLNRLFAMTLTVGVILQTKSVHLFLAVQTLDVHFVLNISQLAIALKSFILA